MSDVVVADKKVGPFLKSDVGNVDDSRVELVRHCGEDSG